MKRAISVLLALVLLLCAQGVIPPVKAAVTSSGQCGDDVWWEYDAETDTTRVFGTGPMWDNGLMGMNPSSGKVKLPNCSHIVFEDGITSIGNFVLWKHSIQTVSLPDSLEAIGIGSFANCAELRAVILPNGLEAIGSCSFADCVELREIILPETVHTIEGGAFFNTGLTSIFIPQNVVFIGGSAFWTPDMEEIQVDPQNEQFASLDGVLFRKDMKTLIAYPIGSRSKHYTVPHSVETIGYGAFRMAVPYSPNFDLFPELRTSQKHCLETVSFPDSLRTVGDSAFYYQRLLRDLRLPRSIESLGSESFCDVKSFSCIEIPATVNKLRSSTFELYEPLHEVYFLGTPPLKNFSFNYFYYPR